jgi:hypothetical protein
LLSSITLCRKGRKTCDKKNHPAYDQPKRRREAGQLFPIFLGTPDSSHPAEVNAPRRAGSACRQSFLCKANADFPLASCLPCKEANFCPLRGDPQGDGQPIGHKQGGSGWPSFPLCPRRFAQGERKALGWKIGSPSCEPSVCLQSHAAPSGVSSWCHLGTPT